MICHYHNQYVVLLLFGESWLKRVPYFVFIIFAQLTPAGLIKPDGSVQLLMPFIASPKYTCIHNSISKKCVYICSASGDQINLFLQS
jgi:hypothetical protein